MRGTYPFCRLFEVFAKGFQLGEKARHLFFERVKGSIPVEYFDRFFREDFSGILADAAAGGIGGKFVDPVPFLPGEAYIETKGPDLFGAGTLIHRKKVLFMF
jgi:hypothetical protein